MNNNQQSSPAPAARPPAARAAAVVLEHRYLALIAAALVVFAGIWATAGIVRATSGPTAKPAGRQTLTSPKDGSLRVGAVAVPQMLGACDGTSCYHLPPAHPVSVPLPKNNTLALKAGVSTVFTVSAYNLANPSLPAPVRVGAAGLEMGKLRPGHYQITLTGQPRGGVWQFRVDVPAAKTAK